MEKYKNDKGEDDLRGYPFVVPGGRFNELYGKSQLVAPILPLH